MTASPLIFQWTDDGVMRPANDLWRKRADARFVVGMLYRLEEVEDASDNTRRHYFAVLRKAWETLPDDLAYQFETPEHLRKFGLIKTGFHNKRTIACDTPAEARRFAAFMRPIDTYAIITTEGTAVHVYTAKSQKASEMDKGQFQKSKQAVLEWVDDLLKVDPGATAKMGESP